MSSLVPGSGSVGLVALGGPAGVAGADVADGIGATLGLEALNVFIDVGGAEFCAIWLGGPQPAANPRIEIAIRTRIAAPPG